MKAVILLINSTDDTEIKHKILESICIIFVAFVENDFKKSL